MFKNKKNIYHFLLILIILLALFLRLKGLATRDIWYDEGLDVIQSEKSLLQITKDVPTPIHYYFVHLALFLGRSTLALGLPSVLFGLGSVYLLFFIGKKIANKNLGLMAAFLMAISPMHIEFSQQILHYSYFIFFTLAGLFFYLDFILGVTKKKIKWRSFVFFILFTFINFLTNISAFLVFLIQFVFLLFFLPLNYQVFKNYKKYLLFFLPVLLIVVYLIFFFNGGHYWQVILENLKFDPQTPIQLGFSLSKQLNTASLKFNLSFFAAMFAWFGQGAGYRLTFYFLLFLIGFVSLIKKRNFALLTFYLSWIMIPFIYLYFVRLEHWFEEKYFIFIIPVYLLMIAEGIIFISRFLAKNLTQIALCLFIFFLALNPIKIRTTYGFPVKEDSHYSWKAVYHYLQKNLGPQDRVFVRRGEGVFPSFYFGSQVKNKTWFEEDYVLSLAASDFQKLATDGARNYFISIPDFKDTFLSTIVSAQFIAKVGEHNIYQINFLKKKDLKITVNTKGEWDFYDDFATARYLIEADDWSNLISTYIGNYNLPMTYGFYNLSPQDFNNGQITYHFQIPKKEPFYIKPLFFLDKGAEFKIYLRLAGGNWQKIYQQSASEKKYFQPLLKMDDSRFLSQDFLLKVEFIIDQNQPPDLKNVGLKSLWLFNPFDKEEKDFKVSQEGQSLNYSYKADLEVLKSHKWLRQTDVSDGWIQSIDGILFRLYGQPEENPLIYKFNFPKTSAGFNLGLKTYAFNNELNVYVKVDDKPWRFWQIKNDNEVKSYNLSIIGGKRLEVKFICQKEGPTCQLRDLNLNAELVQ